MLELAIPLAKNVLVRVGIEPVSPASMAQSLTNELMTNQICALTLTDIRQRHCTQSDIQPEVFI